MAERVSVPWIDPQDDHRAGFCAAARMPPAGGRASTRGYGLHHLGVHVVLHSRKE